MAMRAPDAKDDGTLRFVTTGVGEGLILFADHAVTEGDGLQVGADLRPGERAAVARKIGGCGLGAALKNANDAFNGVGLIAQRFKLECGRGVHGCVCCGGTS